MKNHATDPAEVARAYINYLRTDEERYFWAWSFLNDSCAKDLDTSWEIILALLHQAEGDSEISRIGAGPLENILRIHGLQALAKIEDEYSEEINLKLALHSVWLSRDHAAFEKLAELLDERSGFSDGTYPPMV